MPPKQKKNKAKIEAELKEQERIRELQEEDKRKALQEEKEKKALEERIIFRNEEVDRFVDDMKHYDEILAKRNNEYFFKRHLFEESQEWNELLTCDMKKFRTDVRHLNTFITEWFDTDLCLNKLGSFFDEIHDFILGLSSELLHDRAMNYQVEATLIRFSPKFKKIAEDSINTITTECMEHFSIESGKEEVKSFGSRCKNPSFGFFFHKIVGATSSSPGVKIELPPSLASDSQGKILIRIVKTPFYPRAEQRYNDGDIVVGGTFQVHLFRSYARSQLGGWNVLDDSQNRGELLEPLKELVRYELEIPSNIVPSDMTKVMSLDNNNNLISGAVENINIDFKRKKVSFTFGMMGTTFAISQSRTQDLPYKNWSLTPSFKLGSRGDFDSDSTVDFCLETTRFHIRIRIDGANCSLLEPSLPELDHLLEKPMSPTKLLVSLSSCGIHIIPSDTDFIDSTKLTDVEMEDVFCRDIALLSTVFDIKSSHYNAKRGGGNVGIFQVKESNALKGFIDPFPMHLMKIELDSESTSAIKAPGSKLLPKNLRNVKYEILEGEELFDSGCNTDQGNWPVRTKDGSRSSVSPLICMAPFCSSEAMEKIENCSHLEVETVKQILKLTRPLPFC